MKFYIFTDDTSLLVIVDNDHAVATAYLTNNLSQKGQKHRLFNLTQKKTPKKCI